MGFSTIYEKHVFNIFYLGHVVESRHANSPPQQGHPPSLQVPAPTRNMATSPSNMQAINPLQVCEIYTLRILSLILTLFTLS